jgi:hypothetical protein
MEVSVAVLTGRQLSAREAPYAVFPMNADALFLNDVGMAGGAVDGVESASVAPVISTDVALEALRFAVRRGSDVTDVVVTFEARIGNFCCAYPGEEREAEHENGEGSPHDRVLEGFRGRGHSGIMRLLPAKRTESGSRYTRM